MKRNLIIMFHKIDDVAWFERVILLLKSEYTLIGLDHISETNTLDAEKGLCHITFDDGDRTFFTAAYPVLTEHNIPSTIFVSPHMAVAQQNFWFQEVGDYRQGAMIEILSKQLSLPTEAIGDVPFKVVLKALPLDRIKEVIELYQEETNTPPKPCQNMSLAEIGKVAKSGLVSIGAHTLNHPILRNEDDATSDREISGSIGQLQDMLGQKIRYFAYPNGQPGLDFGAREIDCLRRNDIKIAVSTEVKLLSRNDEMLTLPRIGISHGSMGVIRVKLLLGPFWEKLKPLMPLYSESKSRQDLMPIMRSSQSNWPS